MVTMRPRPWSRMCGNTACMPQSVPFGPGVQEHVHVVLGDLGERGDRAERLRVRDEAVDAPELGDGLLDERERALAVGDVEGGRQVRARRWRRARPRVSSSASGLRAVITSDAPLRARCRAMPRPTPFDAPVTMTTCPSTELSTVMSGTSRRRARRGAAISARRRSASTRGCPSGRCDVEVGERDDLGARSGVAPAGGTSGRW